MIEYIIIGIAAYFLIRGWLLNWLVRRKSKKAVYKEYFDVLNMPQYKVKNQFEE